MNPEILTKLRKILALADPSRNPNAGEVEAAMAKAAALAAAHDLDLAEVLASAPSDAPTPIEAEALDVEPDSLYERPHHNMILWVLRQVFGVHSMRVQSRAPNGKISLGKIVLIGAPSDAAISKELFPWMCQIYLRSYIAYIKREGLIGAGLDTLVRRKNFYLGLSQGIISANKKAEEALPTQQRSSMALVRVRKEDVVAAKAQELFPNARSRAIRMNPNAEAQSRGYSEGSQIRLRQVGSTSATQNLLQ